jgi:hypothetical protein
MAPGVLECRLHLLLCRLRRVRLDVILPVVVMIEVTAIVERIVLSRLMLVGKPRRDSETPLPWTRRIPA